MSSGQMRFFSTALGRMVRFNVLIPNGRGPYPVLYLLHGRGDDCDGWLRHTNIELLFAAHRLIVVMPEAATSYYLNTPGPAGERYEDFLLEDLLPYVERTFPAVADRNGRALAGLSMGGYGALVTAMRHPELFAAARSMSGAVYFAAMPHPRGLHPQTKFMEAMGADYSCFELAERSATLPVVDRPALRFCCGHDDYLLEPNRALHAHMEELALPHEYEEFPGEHNWDYWQARLPEALGWVVGHVSAD